jgi:hypothetical protein
VRACVRELHPIQGPNMEIGSQKELVYARRDF